VVARERNLSPGWPRFAFEKGNVLAVDALGSRHVVDGYGTVDDEIIPDDVHEAIGPGASYHAI
jgi:hypothetical protein